MHYSPEPEDAAEEPEDAAEEPSQPEPKRKSTAVKAKAEPKRAEPKRAEPKRAEPKKASKDSGRQIKAEPSEKTSGPKGKPSTAPDFNLKTENLTPARTEAVQNALARRCTAAFETQADGGAESGSESEEESQEPAPDVDSRELTLEELNAKKAAHARYMRFSRSLKSKRNLSACHIRYFALIIYESHWSIRKNKILINNVQVCYVCFVFFFISLIWGTPVEIQRAGAAAKNRDLAHWKHTLQADPKQYHIWYSLIWMTSQKDSQEYILELNCMTMIIIKEDEMKITTILPTLSRLCWESDRLAILMEQWTACEGHWTQSSFYKQLKVSKKHRQRGARKWMTFEEIAAKYHSERVATRIVESKEADPELSKTQIRDHLDCAEPSLKSSLFIVSISMVYAYLIFIRSL